MNVLQNVLQNPAVLAWGWALVHFLWQGTLLAIVAWLMLSLGSRWTAQARYLIATGFLFAAAVCPLLTWFSLEKPLDITAPPTNVSMRLKPETIPQYDPPLVIEQLKPAALPEIESANFAPAMIASEVQQQTQGSNWQVHLERALPWFVSIWLTGVLLLSLRLVGGWWLVRRLIFQGTTLEPHWASVAKNLLEQLPLNRSIRWLQSSSIQVPQVIGWWMPVILVPTSIFSTLTPKEIESLLIHELAHIRRHDFIINLLQCIIETIFFFHPAVWWLSARIRLERELACDQVVVNVTGDTKTFTRALLLLAEQTLLPRPSLAATESDLTKRIHAILGVRRARSTQAWAVLFFVAVCITVAGACMQINQAAPIPDSEMEVVDNVQDQVIERFFEKGILVPTLSGVIIDERGKPIPNAVVYLRQSGRKADMSRRPGNSTGPHAWKDLARMKSDANGRFRFFDVLDSETDRVSPLYDIVAIKDKYSIGWKHTRPTRKGAKLTVTLRQPSTISGTVVDESGKPVADAKVRLKQMMSIRHITQADLELGRWPSWTDSNFVSLHGFREAPSTTTDAEGRFQLTGAVSNSGAIVEVLQPKYQIKTAFTATVTKLDADTAAKTKRDVQTGQVAIALKRGYQVIIKVVDDKTGKPIVNCGYNLKPKFAWFTPPPQTVNGEKVLIVYSPNLFESPPSHRAAGGTIQINHLSSPKLMANVYPPEQSEYLAYSRYLDWPEDERVKKIEVRLKKGIPVHGHVTSASDKWIAGVEVFASEANAQGFIPEGQHHTRQPFVADEQGKFTAYLLPGDYTFATRRFNQRSTNPQGIELSKDKITVTETGTDKGPVLIVYPAEGFRFMVTDPSGKPASDINIKASLHSITGTTDEHGEYILGPVFKRISTGQRFQGSGFLGAEVVFRNKENTLGARIILQRPKQDDPLLQTVDVRLEKLGTVVGRTVSKQTGKPISKTYIWLYKYDHHRNTARATGEFTRTDSSGRFELRGVLLDAEHYLSMKHTQYEKPNGLKTRFQIKTPEAFDMGDIELSSLIVPDVPELKAVKAPDVTQLSPESAFEKLESSYLVDYKKYRDEYKNLKLKYTSSIIISRRDPTPPYCKAFMELALRDPKSDIALKSYLSIINSRRTSGSIKACAPFREKANTGIKENFLDRPEMAECILVAVTGKLEDPSARFPKTIEQAIEAAERLMKENPHREVQARACYYLVDHLMNILKGRSRIYSRQSNPSGIVVHCRHYLERLKNEFPDQEHFMYGTYEKASERLLYDIDHMLVGKTPPDLVGTDVTGKQVKLSDFRGKITLVQFWDFGHANLSNAPTLKNILAKANGRVARFIIVPSSQQEALDEIEEFKITDPVFAQSTKGPFFTKWNIHSYPTFVVLDEEGEILYRGNRGLALENTLLEKLAE